MQQKLVMGDFCIKPVQNSFIYAFKPNYEHYAKLINSICREDW